MMFSLTKDSQVVCSKCPTLLALFKRTRSRRMAGKIMVKPYKINHEFYKYIDWVPPIKYKVWEPPRSCDLQTLPAIDKDWIRMEYRPITDKINELPEEHRKLFTVGFGHRRDGVDIIKNNAIKEVQRHKYDMSSFEVKITKYTMRIRNFQELFKTDQNFRRSGFHRRLCKEAIDKRRKWLRRCREKDYKRFEWIIEVLGILYKEKPENVKIERRASLNLLVNMFCNEMREKKMLEYQQVLESQKIPFLERKLETLMRIKSDEESINLPCSVEEDIEETKTKLERLKNSHTELQPGKVESVVGDNI